MSKNGLVVLVHINGAAEEMTLIVVPEERACATIPFPKPHSSWRQSALSVALILFRALSGSAALALMHGAQRIRWAEVLNWLLS